ncbi:hypothetical protein HHL19_19585 [Streptomyces sp. R302]|uniref:DUF3592 domain-containing protein n=1 Tax=unclassified Streptomyces TaxID=2593676 RepID=UPI00145DF61B|nr:MULTISPECIES: DUF3592 domain-containing protein [unclassified Streptomyces]NML50714.1 hypothetical protein [Streptomyces sp. R301]NML80809.1 hypothetical protein [Streptomyces sp. R302]
MGRPESVIFEGTGSCLRLDDGMVTVMRQGHVTVIASLRAVHHVDVEETGGWANVRLHITEEDDDGSTRITSYAVNSRNSTAAHAFRRVVTAAVEGARRDPEARLEVRRVEAPGWSRRKRRWMTVAAVYTCLAISGFAAGDTAAKASLILLHLGLAFLAGAWFFLRPPVVLAHRGITVRADVVRYHHTSQTVRPRYRYTTTDGDTITADSAIQLFRTHANDRVDVTYDPNRPEFVICRSESLGHQYAPGVLCAMLGLWWTLVSAAELIGTAAQALTQ